MGSGGAPEGVLTAAALRCLGGQILGRFVLLGGPGFVGGLGTWMLKSGHDVRTRRQGVNPRLHLRLILAQLRQGFFRIKCKIYGLKNIRECSTLQTVITWTVRSK